LALTSVALRAPSVSAKTGAFDFGSLWPTPNSIDVKCRAIVAEPGEAGLKYRPPSPAERKTTTTKQENEHWFQRINIRTTSS